ncbi:hypothetical protein EXU48_00270 [Occultella glacieicola]|uniref:Calcineurin-like phosphoesterase domain-containing protein n=1 Tax=Occultella glacieicola TaxID=2518684 RepID=A0ABY2E9S5_9MICO|nr:metallophosphoesterase [Occultella glacieicola]TDE98691.1 hypothetical protein EXU48_00270 [Occultella glacieicola]
MRERHGRSRRAGAVAWVTGAGLVAAGLLAPPALADAADGTPVLTPEQGTYLYGDTPVAAEPVVAGDPVTALRIDGENLAAEPTTGNATLLFNVGTNSIEARFGNAVVVNGNVIPLTERDYVDERVALPVPNDFLLTGTNTVEFVTGSTPSSCGDNFDDFDVSDLAIETLDADVDSSANEWAYQMGDGSCGSNTARLLEVALTFELDGAPGTTTGLSGALDTTTLTDGTHTIEAITASGASTSHSVIVNNGDPGAPVITPEDGALLNGTRTFLAAPPVEGGSPGTVASFTLDGAPMTTVPTLGAGTSAFVFTVGSNSIEARYGNTVVVNGLPIMLGDHVSETVRVDVPNTYLLAGSNTIEVVAGTFTTSCGDNRDDFVVSDLSLELSQGTAVGQDIADSYNMGDGNCGSDTTKPREISLTFDVDAETSGLRADVDTATIADGEHTLTATTASGATARRALTTDNTGPALVGSTPAVGAEIGSPVPLAVELDDLSGLLGEPTLTLDGAEIAPGTSVGPGLTAGEHVIVVSAVDVLGNTSTHEITFVALGVPAVPTDLAPANGAVVTTDSVALSAVVAEPDGADVTATFNRASADGATTAYQGVSDTVPTTLDIDGAQEVGVNALNLGDGLTLDSDSGAEVVYQRFDLATESDLDGSTVAWQGTIDPQRLASLYVWDTRAGAWELADSARGTFDGVTALSAPSAARHLDDGVVHVLVTGTDPFADDIDPGDPDSFADRGDYDFALAHFTDTQYLSEGAVEQESEQERAVWQEAYTDVTQWIADNADERGIAYAAHTGDIIENYTQRGDDPAYVANARAEYEVSSAAQAILDDAGIPNGVLAGNHDNGTGTDDGPGALYNEYYGPERYEALSGTWENAAYGAPWREGDNQNHYDLFTAGGLDFVAVYLSYGVTNEEADWANEVLAQYADRNAILLAHDYLRPSLNPDGRDAGFSSRDGALLYNRVVTVNPNVFLVLGGHEHGVGTNVRSDVGADGNGVVEMLADYQFYEVTAERAGLVDIGGYDPAQGLRFGASFFRLLQFDTDRSEMIVDTYSPWLENFGATEFDTDARYNGLEDDMVLPVDLSSRATSVSTDGVALFTPTGEVIGTATAVSGSSATVTWADLEPNQTYAWFVEAASAAGGVTLSETKVFSTEFEAPGEIVPVPREALEPGNRGTIDLPPSARAGASLTVDVGVQHAGTEVGTYLYATPLGDAAALGTAVVGDDGTVTITLPADARARARIAVLAADEVILGWDDMTVIPTRG